MIKRINKLKQGWCDSMRYVDFKKRMKIHSIFHELAGECEICPFNIIAGCGNVGKENIDSMIYIRKSRNGELGTDHYISNGMELFELFLKECTEDETKMVMDELAKLGWHNNTRLT